jgi:hypothetical protein
MAVPHACVTAALAGLWRSATGCHSTITPLNTNHKHNKTITYIASTALQATGQQHSGQQHSGQQHSACATPYAATANYGTPRQCASNTAGFPAHLQYSADLHQDAAPLERPHQGTMKANNELSGYAVRYSSYDVHLTCSTVLICALLQRFQTSTSTHHDS